MATRRSVLDMLVRQRPNEEVEVDKSTPGAQERLQEPRNRIGTLQAYMEEVTKQIEKSPTFNQLWIQPCPPLKQAAEVNAQRTRDNEKLLDAGELWNIFLRPPVFVWDPERWLSVIVRCPDCKSKATRSSWRRSKVLHHQETQSMYLTVQYKCYNCSGLPPRAGASSSAPRQRKTTYFSADSHDVLATLPKPAMSAWRFANTGRVLCDASLVDFIRALATRTSWAALADIIFELKSTSWMRSVKLPYLQLCHDLRLKPIQEALDLPREYHLSSDWCKNAYLSDAAARKPQLYKELAAEIGDDVLRIDWTDKAAKHCRASHILNVMDGQGSVLLSQATATSKPWEARAFMVELERRGVRPKVAYVDDECCGAWATLLKGVWPGIQIKLDAMHALARITQTTSSTQHPWHAEFCEMLGGAIYSEDPEVKERLERAWQQDKRFGKIPKGIKRKFVPRQITNALRIAEAIEAVVTSFKSKSHPDAGPLITDKTTAAWANLKRHVLNGCLCDPSHLRMQVFDGHTQRIGGEDFRRLRTLRGTSPLEGFHAHQQQWFGAFSQHGAQSSQALLDDGTFRWNVKKRHETSASLETPVYDHCLANSLCEIRDRLAAQSAQTELAE